MGFLRIRPECNASLEASAIGKYIVDKREDANEDSVSLVNPYKFAASLNKAPPDWEANNLMNHLTLPLREFLKDKGLLTDQVGPFT
jgi:hypothetical protein